MDKEPGAGNAFGSDDARNTYRRMFRILFLLSCGSVMFYFIVQAIRAYYGYPTQTSIAIVVEWPQTFPAVTVCNYSPIRSDRFVEPFLNYTNDTSITKEHVHHIHQFLIDKLNRNEPVTEFFYPLEAMLISCNYNQLPCTAENFTWFLSPRFGLCYTFNARLKPHYHARLKNNSDNGFHGALDLRFYVHQHQYVPYLSNGIGMVTLVHDNTQLPNIDLLATLLAPGRHHKLGYQKKTSLFLAKPYTQCNDRVNIGMRAVFEGYREADYGFSQLPCFWACTQAYIYEKCGCGHPFYWVVRSVVMPGHTKRINITLCNVDNPCYSPTMTQFMNTNSIWMNYCPDCTQECSYTDFQIKPSSVLAPPTQLLHDIKTFVEQSAIPLPANWSTSWISDIQAGYVSLEVAYETTRSEIYSQKATISLVDVISNVGGQTGLWIGISFFSLVEVAETLYQLLRRHCRRLCTAVQTQMHELSRR